VIYSPHHRRNVSRAGGSGINPRWDDLVAGWKLDEESDGSAPVARADVLGNYELTDVNTTPSAAGIISLAAAPTGAESLQNANTTAFSFLSGGGLRTISFWIDISESASNRQPFGNYKANDTGSWWIYDVATTHSLYLQISTPVVKNCIHPALGLGWHYVVAGYDDVAGKSFIVVDDGVPALSAAFELGAVNGVTLPLTIKQETHDEVYLFSVTKDAAWITDMRNAGAGRSYPN